MSYKEGFCVGKLFKIIHIGAIRSSNTTSLKKKKNERDTND